MNRTRDPRDSKWLAALLHDHPEVCWGATACRSLLLWLLEEPCGLQYRLFIPSPSEEGFAYGDNYQV